MPYSKTHYFMLALLVITVIAFWPSYFGQLSKAPLAHHLHGVTSTLWVLLIAWQSWLIHSGRRQAHRTAGKLMFVLVPLMTAAFALVTWAGAQKAVGGHPFYTLFGQALLTADVWLTVDHGRAGLPGPEISPTGPLAQRADDQHPGGLVATHPVQAVCQPPARDDH